MTKYFENQWILTNMSADEDRSDTESPVGPVRGPSEPIHGYVNLPQKLKIEENEDMQGMQGMPPPLVAKKDRSR